MRFLFDLGKTVGTAYVSPTGSGKKDGSSWANAATIDQLSTLISKVGAGGTVELLADHGAYTLTQSISLYAGGTAAASVKIMGVDSSGHASNAQIVGTRPGTYSVGEAAGNEIFRVLNGANYLDFSNLTFKNVGTAIRVGADVSGLSVHDIKATNVARFFEDYASGSNKTATISGLDIHDVTVDGFSKGAVRLQYDTHNVSITNVIGDSQRQDGDNFAEGVALQGTAHDVVIKSTTMKNATDTVDNYWNGDGFATEVGNYNIKFIDTIASGNTDAGYDIKSSTTTLLRAVAEDNNRNFRIWAKDTVIQDSTARDPHHRGGIGGASDVWFAKGAGATIINSVLDNGSNTTAVLDLGEGGVKATLQGTTITKLSNVATAFSAAGSVLTQTAALTAPSSTAPQAIVSPPAATAPAATPPVVSPSVSVGASNAMVSEGSTGSTLVTFVMTRSGDLTHVSDVAWSVAGAGDHPADVKDFQGGVLPTGSVEFAAGETSKTVTVTVAADTTVEASESFQLSLAAVKNATLSGSSAVVTIVNDDVAAPAPVSGDLAAVNPAARAVFDGSAAAAQTLAGTTGGDTFSFDNTMKHGADVIASFGPTDVLSLKQAIYDGNKDGLLTFGGDHVLHVNAPSNAADTVKLTNIDGAKGVRLLGQDATGRYLYADATVKPLKAVEGTLGGGVMTGDKGDKVQNVFFMDLALNLSSRQETITTFGGRDVLVTTSPLGPASASLAGGAGYVTGATGGLHIKDASGAAVTNLVLEGALHHGDVDYYVYGLTGSHVSTSDIHFG